MYQITIRCKSLRLAERFKNGSLQEAGAAGERTDVEEWTEASLQGGDDKTNFFFSFPVNLLDENMRIGDEILVTFERKNK